MEMTLALKRRFPAAWVEELRQEVERQGLPHVVDGEGPGMELVITADEADVPTFTAWLAEHGDAEPARIFGAKRHQFESPKRELSLFPGQAATRPAVKWTPELTGMDLDLPSVQVLDGRLTAKGTVQRLIPNSGFFGRMGMYEVTLSVEDVTDHDTSDLVSDELLPVAYFHHDPACRRLAIGSPIHGALLATTSSGDVNAEIGEEPIAVRRWRRFLPV